MKTVDLRLGNYVNVPRPDQSPFRIDEIEYMTATDCKVGMNVFSYIEPTFGTIQGHTLTWYFADLSPIPLTEEWLLKLGFKCQDSFGRSWSIGKIPVWFENRTISLRHYDYYEIKYVHSLQNLIHAITGEELTIKQ